MSKPQRVVTSTTHYWCEYCLKFIKNTAIDRKNHENGVPHQDAKAKKITELRSGSAESKLADQLAHLEKAAVAAVHANLSAPAYTSEYSTYTPTISTLQTPTNTAPTIKKSVPSKPSTSAKSESKESDSVVEAVSEASKEAALPGTWEVVEEVEQEDEEAVEEEIYSGVGAHPNPKKRERYGEEESALDQMEEESRAISRQTKGERVPEAYRADSLAPAQDSEPVFKSKVAKGGNIKKRVKQL